MREHFLGLRGDELLGGTCDEIPKEKWGYSPEVNQMLDDYLGAGPESEKTPKEESALVEMGGHPEIPPLPALLRFDLGTPGPPPVPRPERSPGHLFIGVGQDLRDLTEWHFAVSIPVGEGHEGKRCLVLLIDLPCVSRLAKALGQDDRWPARDDERPGHVIAAALSPDVLEPPAFANAPGRHRAYDLALVLSGAPALEGAIRRGLFEAIVPFELACPGPERGTYLAFALGTQATPPRETTDVR